MTAWGGETMGSSSKFRRARSIGLGWCAALALVVLPTPSARASKPLDAGEDFWPTPGVWTVSVGGARVVEVPTAGSAIFGPFSLGFAEVGAGTFVCQFFGANDFIGELVGAYTESKAGRPILTADPASLSALITQFHDF